MKFQFVDRIEDITDIVNQKIAAGEVTEVNALTRPFLNKLAKELFEKSDLKGKKALKYKLCRSMPEINSICSIRKCTQTYVW